MKVVGELIEERMKDQQYDPVKGAQVRSSKGIIMCLGIVQVGCHGFSPGASKTIMSASFCRLLSSWRTTCERG